MYGMLRSKQIKSLFGFLTVNISVNKCYSQFQFSALYLSDICKLHNKFHSQPGSFTPHSNEIVTIMISANISKNQAMQIVPHRSIDYFIYLFWWDKKLRRELLG